MFVSWFPILQFRKASYLMFSTSLTTNFFWLPISSALPTYFPQPTSSWTQITSAVTSSHVHACTYIRLCNFMKILLGGKKIANANTLARALSVFGGSFLTFVCRKPAHNGSQAQVTQFSKNVNTNIGHRFLSLVDKHFHKDHKLRKIFNRNTIKISYSCMSNTKRIIDNHNKQILKSSELTANTGKRQQNMQLLTKENMPA